MDYGMEEVSFDDDGGTSQHRTELRAAYEVFAASLDEHQASAANAPIDKPLTITANAGCISGDTKIKFNRAGKSFECRIKDAFLHSKGQARNSTHNWDPETPTKVRSYRSEHNRIQLNGVREIVQSGVKTTYNLDIPGCERLWLTEDHPILTEEGYVELRNLSPIHRVMVDNHYRYKKTSKENHKRKIRYPERATGSVHPYSRACKINRGRQTQYRVGTHRLAYEAGINGIDLDTYIKSLHSGNIPPRHWVYINPQTTHIHHKDGNPLNNEFSNLEALSVSDHIGLHSEGYSNFNYGAPEYRTPLSIMEKSREEMTYDIICQDPDRNFVAQNVIIHNSGKTRTLLARALKMITIDGVDPSSIVLITYTNRAANEIRDRLKEFLIQAVPNLNLATTSLPHVSTIHSFAYQQLRVATGRYYTIMSDYAMHKHAREQILRTLGVEKIEAATVKGLTELLGKLQSNHQLPMILKYRANGADGGRPTTAPADPQDDELRLHQNMSRTAHHARARNREIPDIRIHTEDVRARLAELSPLPPEVTETLLREILRHRATHDLLSFDDIQHLLIHTLISNPLARNTIQTLYRHFIIDEGQDISNMELATVTCCHGDTWRRIQGGETQTRGHITLISDTKQTLFEFRAADPLLCDAAPAILGADTEQRNLTNNYRSPAQLVLAANMFAEGFSGTTAPSNAVRPPRPGRGTIRSISLPHQKEENSAVTLDLRKRKLATNEPWSNFTIIARTNRQLQQITHSLVARQIPHKMKFDHRSEVRSSTYQFITAIYSCLLNPRDTISLGIALQSVKGLGEKTARDLANQISSSVTEDGLSPVSALGGLKYSRRAAKAKKAIETLILPITRAFEQEQEIHHINALIQARLYKYADFTDTREKSKEIELSFDGEQLRASLELIEDVYGALSEDLAFTKLDDRERLARLYETLLTSTEANADRDRDAIQLTTVHAYKGLESPHVYYIGQGGFNMVSGDRDPHGERCVFYVAITRATETLTISRAERVMNSKRQFIPAHPNPFLIEYQQGLELLRQKQQSKRN